MADKETNKKIHVDGHSRGEKKFKYGYVSGERWEAGSHHLRYEDANNEKGFYVESVESHGSYSHTEHHDKDKAHTATFNAGEERNYTFGGASDHFDGHRDINGECTGRQEWLFDFGRAIGGDLHDAVKGQRKNITKGGEAEGQAGSSGTIRHGFHQGSRARDTTLDAHELIRNNYSIYTGNSSIQYTDGEDTRYTGGNYDRYVDKQYHVYSKEAYTANTDSTMDLWSKDKMNAVSEADIKIKSDTKITLEVGNSKITIESNKITIESQQVEIKGTGSVKINGSPVQINDGTNTTPPFQVT